MRGPNIDLQIGKLIVRAVAVRVDALARKKWVIINCILFFELSLDRPNGLVE